MDGRATPKEIREYFGADRPVTLTELKKLKTDPKDYDAIAVGIGNGTFTY